MIDALISVQKAGIVLTQLPESQLQPLLEKIEDDKISRILKHGATNDGTVLLLNIDPSRHEALLAPLPGPQRTELLQFLNYPEDSAGRMMNPDFFSLRAELTAQQGLKHLREKAKEESIYYIYCVSTEGKLTGVVSLRDLATCPPDLPLADVAKTEVVAVQPDTPATEVAQLVSHYDFIAIPVVDRQSRILGVVTVDDVLDIIEEQATADIYASAGLQESDRVYSPLVQKVRNRTPWMMLNLVLAGCASAVLSQFEHVLDELVLLAVTKNIVTSTSGNAAIQSLTVTTRGAAVNDFQFISRSKAMTREILVGLAMGTLTGMLAGLAIFIWKGVAGYGLIVGGVMFISMILTTLVATTAGSGVPLLLKRLNRDPAVGSGVIVTVITDIFGFFSFLGLAALAFKYFQPV